MKSYTADLLEMNSADQDPWLESIIKHSAASLYIAGTDTVRHSCIPFFLLLQYADVSLTYFMTSPILSLRYCKDRVNNIYVFPRDDVEPISAEESSG